VGGGGGPKDEGDREKERIKGERVAFLNFYQSTVPKFAMHIVINVNFSHPMGRSHRYVSITVRSFRPEFFLAHCSTMHQPLTDVDQSELPIGHAMC
jgi:hypothetical protein